MCYWDHNSAMKNQKKWRFPSPGPVFARFYENVQETTSMLSRDIDATVQSFYQAPPIFVVPDLVARGDLETGIFGPASIHEFPGTNNAARDRTQNG